MPRRAAVAKAAAGSSSWCRTGQLVDAGVVSTAAGALAWHYRCKGVFIGPDSRVTGTCPCRCHADHPRCAECGSEDAELNPAAQRCVDVPACAGRIQAQLAQSGAHQRMQTAREAGAAERAARRDG